MDLYIKDAITPVNAGDHLSLRQVVGDKSYLLRCPIKDT
jgi:hypothetical protein